MVQNKRSKRILVLVASICVAAVIGVLVYLFCNKIDRFAEDAQKMEFLTTQTTSLEEAIQDAEEIKEPKEDSVHEQLLKTICDDYIKTVDTFPYSSEAGYFLFDIDKNGVPELWLKTGTYEAEYQLRVYTYDTEIKLLFNDNAGHSDFYLGDDYVIKLYAHMGDARWDKLAYDGNEIVSTTIFQEDINGTDRDYTEPTEKWIELYSPSDKQPILDAFQVGRQVNAEKDVEGDK